MWCIPRRRRTARFARGRASSRRWRWSARVRSSRADSCFRNFRNIPNAERRRSATTWTPFRTSRSKKSRLGRRRDRASRARRLESPEERRRPEDGEDERCRPRDVGGGVGVAFPRERRRRSGRAARRASSKKAKKATRRPKTSAWRSRRRAGVPARDGQTEAGFVLDFTRSGARAFARSDRTRAGFETGRRVGRTNRREVRARLVSGARRLPGPGNRGRGTAPPGVSSQSSL